MLQCQYASPHLSLTHTNTQDVTHVKRLERLCDAVVRLESFAGSDKEQNPLYKDYHGERERECWLCHATII